MTLEVLFLTALFPFVLLLGIHLFRGALGTLSFKELTPYSYAFYVVFLMQALVASYIALWGVRFHIGVRSIAGDGPFAKGTVAVIAGFLIVPATMIIVARAARFDPRRDLRRYRAKPAEPLVTRGDSAVFQFFLALTVVTVIVAVYLLVRSPLVALIGGEDDLATLSRARNEYEFSAVGDRILQSIFGGGLTAVLAYSTFAYALWRKHYKWWILLAVQIGPAVLLQAASLAKSPAAVFALGFVFIYVAVRGRIGLRGWVTAACVLLMLVSVAYSQVRQKMMPDELSWDEVFGGDNLVGRVLVGQYVGLPNFFDIFPNQHPFLHGSELQALALIGERPKTAARISMEYQFPGSLAANTVGMQNSFFTGAAYANFGWPGVFLAPVWVGLLLQGVQIAAVRARKTPLILGWSVWTMFQFTKGLGGGLMSEFVGNTTVIGTAIIVGVVLVAIRRFGRPADHDTTLRIRGGTLTSSPPNGRLTASHGWPSRRHRGRPRRTAHQRP